MKLRRSIIGAALATGALLTAIQLAPRFRQFDLVDPTKEQSFRINDFLHLGTILTVNVKGTLDGDASLMVGNLGGGASNFSFREIHTGTVDETISFGTSGQLQQIVFYPKSAKKGRLSIKYKWD